MNETKESYLIHPQNPGRTASDSAPEDHHQTSIQSRNHSTLSYLQSLLHCWTRFENMTEPPLKEGKVRIRWTCQCGEALWDDFRELQPGAAERLRRQLDVHERMNEYLYGNSSNEVNTSSLTARLPGNSLVSETAPVPSIPTRKNNGTGSRGTSSRADRRIGRQIPNWQQPAADATADKRFLLVAMRKPGDDVPLFQLDLQGIRDDVELGQMLKRAHTKNRGMFHFLSPVRIKAVFFRRVCSTNLVR